MTSWLVLLIPLAWTAFIGRLGWRRHRRMLQLEAAERRGKVINLDAHRGALISCEIYPPAASPGMREADEYLAGWPPDMPGYPPRAWPS